MRLGQAVSLKLGTMLLAAGCILGMQAQAAEPRDAIRELPRLQHSSQFDVVSDGSSQGQSVQQETYTGQWDVNWRPRPFSLPGGMRVDAGLGYTLKATDISYHLTGGSSDARQDTFNFVLNVDSPELQSGFAWTRQDTWTGAGIAGADAELQVQDSRSARIALQRSGLPQLSIGTASNGTYSSALLGQSGTDYDSYNYGLRYERDFGRGRMMARMSSETWRRRSYPDGTEAASDSTLVEATQSLDMGAIGRLGINYNANERTYIQSGSPEPTVEAQTTLGVTLDGALPLPEGRQLSPLSYSANYVDFTYTSDSPAATSFTDRTDGRLQLILNPPLRSVKAAQFLYESTFWTERTPDRHASSTINTLRWDFSPNGKINSWASYSQTRESDEIAGAANKETHSVQGNVKYFLPGKRGELEGFFRSGFETQPGAGRSTSTSEMVLRNKLALGPNSSLTFRYNRNYWNTSDSLFRLDDSDISNASVVYSIRTPHNISLDATWSQGLSRYSAATRKLDNQNLQLVFIYAAPQDWTYSLSVQGSDAHESGLLTSDYRSRDNISARVTYTF